MIHIANFSSSEQEADALVYCIKHLFTKVFESNQNVHIYFSNKRQLEDYPNFKNALESLKINNFEKNLKELAKGQSLLTLNDKMVTLIRTPYRNEIDSFFDPNCKIIIVPFLIKEDIPKLINIQNKIHCEIYGLYCGKCEIKTCNIDEKIKDA